MAPPHNGFRQDYAEADITIWKEALFGAEILLLHASPVYYGLGIPRGDGSAVVLVPGFLGTDRYLKQLHSWLARIGYRPYFSGIGLNAECPNLLIQHRLNENIEKALLETERKIHLIGHSLGGIITRSVGKTSQSDTVVFYGFGGGITWEATPNFGLRVASDFVHYNFFSNLLDGGRNSVRVVVGTKFSFGKNILKK
jgi:triacylglycerol esterase/lipase EstA (alpha/beta hydrolase family)